MALIEHLESEDWQKNLCRFFERSLDLLETDRGRWAGSALDNLKSWLTCGGVSRVRMHLNNQMNNLRFSSEKVAAVNELLDQLEQDNRHRLLDLIANEIIPPVRKDFLCACGLTETEFEELWKRIDAGERPFEELMRAQGHSDQAIARINGIIDRWLKERNTVPQPFSPSDN